jgi:hypothetical protein
MKKKNFQELNFA